uniref:DegT/DnrJ/EryC1/StrS aminotransferase n=1 Tax=Caulobacter sp. (strain K31) TaxID=366602 RepID=B0T5A4_CAUSK
MNFFSTSVSEAAIEKVVSVLRSGFLNEGAVVKEFEAALAEYISGPTFVTTNSATAALHLCLVHLGIGPGDEVIVPPQTFVATGLIVLHAGATPVFADIDPLTGNIDPVSIREKITARTKAVIPVHWGGEPCDMDAINQIASEAGIAVIEDAAHAFGAEYKGRKIGSLSRLTCFSFQAIKGMTTGDGGAIATMAEDDAIMLTRRRWFGIDKLRTPVTDIGERSVAIDILGYKYHMNNIAAALGVGNLPDDAARLARRREIGATYIEALVQVPGLRHIQRRTDSRGSFWLFPVLVDEREAFGRAMKSRNVPITVVDRRIDKHPILGGLRDDLPGIAMFDMQQIHLPVNDALTEEEVQRVVDSVKMGW